MNKNNVFRSSDGAKRASGREVGAPRRRQRRALHDGFQQLEERQLLTGIVIQTATYSATIPQQVTDYSLPLTLPKFDPALGTLDSVAVTLDASGVVNLATFNNSDSPSNETVTVLSNDSLLDGPTNLVTASLNVNQSFPIPPNANGTAVGPFTAADSQTATFTTGSVFNDFASGPGAINLDLSTTTGQTTVGGNGNSAVSVTTVVGGTATVVYTYSVATVSVSGNVYNDANDSGSFDPGDLPIPGTTLTLVSSNGNIVATTTTAANGSYSFTTTSTGGPLFAGDYAVVETQPAGYLQGSNTVGTVNGVTTGSLLATDVIGSILLTPGQSSINNNFGEVLPVALNGTVYDDLQGTGTLVTGDLPIGGVTLSLYAPDGLVATTTTNASGNYAFSTSRSGTPLAPGTYMIVESQPAGFLQGANTVGTVNGVPTGILSGTDVIGSIVLHSGQASQGNNFGEVLPVALNGTVYDDVNHTGSLMTGDLPIGGVTLSLFDAAGLVATTTTNTSGNYAFSTSTSEAPLAPGTYTIVESQPVGFLQGANTVGTVNGVPTGTLPATDVIGSIVLHSGQASLGNNFGELTPNPPPPPPPPVITTNVNVTNVERFGVHLQPTLVVISFDQPLNAATANDVANYQIFGPTDSKNPKVIPIESATYNPATDMVTLRLSERLNVHHPYRLTINGIQDTSGGLLVGSDGKAGSPYVATVNRSNLSGFTDIYGNFIPINHGQLYPAALASGYQLKKFVLPSNLGSFAKTNTATFLAATKNNPEPAPITLHKSKKLPKPKVIKTSHH